MKKAAVVVVVVVLQGCASVESLLLERRFDAACHLAHDDPGLQFWRDPFKETDALTAAVAENVHANLRLADGPDVRIGEPLGEGGALALAVLEVYVDAPMVVHESSSSFLEGADALAVLLAALPPLIDPPAPLLPPGPLEMPPAPDPNPPAPARSSSSSDPIGGFIGSMFNLVSLPFRIVGEVVGAIGHAVLHDLFGVRMSSGSSSSSSSPPSPPRVLGEAILPAAAFERVKQQREKDHAVALAATATARIERNRRLAPLVAALGERCVATAMRPCHRTVLLGDPSPTLELRVGLGSIEAPCGLDDPLPISGLHVDARNQAARPIAVAPDRAPEEATAVVDAAKVFAARPSAPGAAVDVVADLVCRVDVRAKWKRLLPRVTGTQPHPSLSVRLASGSLIGVGVTVEVPAASRFFVGARTRVQRGDHVKLVVGSIDAARDIDYLGGVVAEFTGVLPLRIEGDSLAVECR
ncbi:MAG: hypothetical protein Q8O67_27535 [Deltaproteobacteria bacterium]|nr:hypothetical protein [Deltaproteobacteria bacterium]